MEDLEAERQEWLTNAELRESARRFCRMVLFIIRNDFGVKATVQLHHQHLSLDFTIHAHGLRFKGRLDAVHVGRMHKEQQDVLAAGFAREMWQWALYLKSRASTDTPTEPS